MFDPTGDQRETFTLKANKVTKDIMIKNRDIKTSGLTLPQIITLLKTESVKHSK